MTGLILKDFLILRKSLRSYLLMLVVYAAIAFSGVWSADIVGVMTVVMVGLLPMNVFAYDKQCSWDTYCLALPVGRTKTVAARYLCVLLLCLFSTALTAVIGFALFAVGRIEEPAEFLISCSTMGLIAVLVNAIMLPLLYKFGPERARMMFIGLMGGIFLLFMAVLFPLGGLEWINSLNLEASTFAQVSAIPVIAALAGIALLAVSFLASRHFYGKKDV